MFQADPVLREPFIHNDIIRYKSVAALIPNDMPLIMVAPAFTYTKRGTNLISNYLSLTREDAWDGRKVHRWEAYMETLWVDAPTVVISLISSKIALVNYHFH